ncbi:hypothetical protein [Actinomadura sp. SCN-SB]|uniref:hypothetical protein n=1 Tax=Actinomadura sp. SCN-SB TaxID=3373092 RepID=UPI0037519155
MTLPTHATAREIARFYRIPLATVYRWASEDTWPRTGRNPVRYSWDAADTSYARRQATYDRSRLTDPATSGEDRP